MQTAREMFLAEADLAATHSLETQKPATGQVSRYSVYRATSPLRATEPEMSESLTFAVCTFKTVFDTVPHHEQVTLAELSRALRRFRLKPKMQQRIDRAMRRIESVYRTWKAGEPLSGKRGETLRQAEREAKRKGEDVLAAVYEAYQNLRAEARHDAKKELRLWAPCVFKPDAKRASENVTHVTCLVLDYDDGTPVDQAVATWQPWFHVLHSTWSHRPEAPRYRVVLPLASPVGIPQYRKLYAWAEERCGGVVDPTGKSIGRAWALPATPSPRAPRIAFTHAGSILNPVLEGIASPSSDPVIPAPIPHDDGFTFAGGVPGERYIEQNDDPSRFGAQPDDPHADDIWSGGAVGVDRFDAPDIWDGGAPEIQLPRPGDRDPAAASTASAPSAAEKAPTDIGALLPAVQQTIRALEHLVSRLDEIVAALETGSVSGDEAHTEPRASVHTPHLETLEHLAMLHESGVLTGAEFREAKAKVIEGMDEPERDLDVPTDD